MLVQCEDCGNPLFEMAEPPIVDNSFFLILAEVEREREEREARERYRFKASRTVAQAVCLALQCDIERVYGGRKARHKIRGKKIRAKNSIWYRSRKQKARQRRILKSFDETPF